MVVSRRKKASRQRGKKTHGWGSKKKHRGSGNRGGRRHAGTGKRGDSKKPSFWKNKKYFGRHGFNRRPSMRKSYNPINVGDLDNSIETFIKSGAAEKKADGYEVDFTKTQFNKLLGKGDTSNKLIITVDSASTKAKDKIEKAGGKLNLLSEAEKDSEDKSDDSDNPSSN